jgi:hypothetical protein
VLDRLSLSICLWYTPHTHFFLGSQL